MSETQNNNVVAAFLTATANAGLMNIRRVEIGGSSAEIDFGNFLKAATQVIDSKERYCQAEKPDYREPGRPSTILETKVKSNQDFEKPKPVDFESQRGTYISKPVEPKKPALDHAVKANDSRIAPPKDTGETVETDPPFSKEIPPELAPLMNQLAQLMALINSQLSDALFIDFKSLKGMDAASLQSLINQLQLMLQPQTGAELSISPDGISNQSLAASASLTLNDAAADLLNQITALMQGNSSREVIFSNDPAGFNQLLSKIAASLKDLGRHDSKTQTAQTAQTVNGVAQQQAPGLASTGEKPAGPLPSSASANFILIETSQAESGDGAAVKLDPPQKELQGQISVSQLAKGAFNEGKPLNLAVIQTQLRVGASQSESGANVGVTPFTNQNNPLTGQIQPSITQEGAPVDRNQLFSQIVERAKFMFANNHSEMEVNLKPDHLGKLQLKIVVENQAVTARFVAESQQVKEMIETNLNQLRDQLRQNGMQVENLTVTVGHQMDPQNFNQTGNNQNGSSHLGGQSQDYRLVNENNDEEAPVLSPQSIRETVIDLIA
ncbi:MAG: flagellar hook-length control protein FliK [Firmicutes bacterium]|nr:flagellar hook-length control protein FliK [Bacillota bacterium]